MADISPMSMHERIISMPGKSNKYAHAPVPSPYYKSPLYMSMLAHKSWGGTHDRTERTHNARQAFREKFLKEADGDPQRAESLRRAFYREIALKSLAAREAKKAGK